MAEYRDLPGWPRKRLVKEVRSHLWRFGIRPKEPAWSATWHWASAIATSYLHTHWPLPSEIASQYIVLMLGQMKESRGFKLPYRANKVIPGEARELISVSPIVVPVEEE